MHQNNWKCVFNGWEEMFVLPAHIHIQCWCLESVQKAGECYQVSYRGCRWTWTFKIFTSVHTYWRWKPCVNEGAFIALVRFSWALWRVRYCWNPGNKCSWLKQGIRCAMRTSPPYTQSRDRQPAGCPWHHLAWGAGTLGFPYHLTAILTLSFQAGKLQVLYFCPKSQGKWNMYHLWVRF